MAAQYLPISLLFTKCQATLGLKTQFFSGISDVKSHSKVAIGTIWCYLLRKATRNCKVINTGELWQWAINCLVMRAVLVFPTKLLMIAFKKVLKTPVLSGLSIGISIPVTADNHLTVISSQETLYRKYGVIKITWMLYSEVELVILTQRRQFIVQIRK